MEVKKILDQEGVWYRIMEVFSHKDYEHFAEYVGDEVDGIVKTIILKVGDDFKAFCVKKEQLVDYKKLRKHFNTKKLRMANADEVLEHSTSPPGACCPLLVDCPLYMDPSVKDMDIIHIGSGSLKHGLEMKTKDLIRITNPEFLDVSVHKNES